MSVGDEDVQIVFQRVGVHRGLRGDFGADGLAVSQVIALQKADGQPARVDALAPAILLTGSIRAAIASSTVSA